MAKGLLSIFNFVICKSCHQEIKLPSCTPDIIGSIIYYLNCYFDELTIELLRLIQQLELDQQNKILKNELRPKWIERNGKLTS